MPKKKLITVLAACLAALPALAGTGDALFTKVANAYKAAKGIAVNYAVTTSDGKYSGAIIMQGNKFRIHSPDMICWFDGKTQWSYSTMSDEVSVMQPTADELQVVNPFSVISNFRTAYNATLLKTPAGSAGEVKLTPKRPQSSDIKEAVVTVAKSSNLPSKIVFRMKDGSKITITLNGYRTGAHYPASTFVYDKKLVPPGTQVVDLR